MRIVATADLHYERADSRPATHRLAERIVADAADALMILGDTFAGREEDLDECLALFQGFPGPKLLCAGNHDLWTAADGDSRAILEQTIPRVAERSGFHVLDQAPLVHEDVGFVGGCGWYDYGFRQPELNVPIEFYRLKMGPGAARRMDPNRSLDLPWDQTPPEAYRISAIWQDGVFVRWGASDEEVSDRMVERLRKDIAAVAPDVRAIVCGAHHIPFEEMVTRKSNANWAFANAFMGSPRIGEALAECEKTRAAIFGHSHCPGRSRIGRIEAVNTGSTYREKRFVEVVV